MAKAKGWSNTIFKKKNTTKKRIGKSKNTKPKNKHKRRGWKKYRGQGR